MTDSRNAERFVATARRAGGTTRAAATDAADHRLQVVVNQLSIGVARRLTSSSPCKPQATAQTIAALEIEPSWFPLSAEVADVEALVSERRTNFHSVSRHRWTIDLHAEAMVIRASAGM